MGSVPSRMTTGRRGSPLGHKASRVLRASTPGLNAYGRARAAALGIPPRRPCAARALAVPRGDCRRSRHACGITPGRLRRQEPPTDPARFLDGGLCKGDGHGVLRRTGRDRPVVSWRPAPAAPAADPRSPSRPGGALNKGNALPITPHGGARRPLSRRWRAPGWRPAAQSVRTMGQPRARLDRPARTATGGQPVTRAMAGAVASAIVRAAHTI